MAINQVQVVGPRSEQRAPEREKKSDLERVMEGLALANTVLGIGSNIQTIREKSGTLDAQKFAAEGGLTKEQETGLLAKGVLRVPKDTPNSVRSLVTTPTGGTEEAHWGPPKEKEVAGLRAPTRMIEELKPDGKTYQTIVDDKPGQSFLKPEKAEKLPEDKVPQTTTDLRKEYNSHKTTQNTYQVTESYNKIHKAFSNKNPTPTDDMSGIFGFMKMQDPTSTVREGEYASAENTRGLSDSVITAYNKAVDGVRLTPEQRANFLASAEGIYDAQLSSQEVVDRRYGDLAKQFGADPKYVLEPEFGSRRANRVPKKDPPGGNGKYPPGSVLKVNGQLVTVGPDGEELIPNTTTVGK